MMTDAQIDELIHKALPELRIALRGVLNGEAVHLFTIASQPLGNGQSWAVVACVLSEPMSVLIESLVKGTEAMGKSYQKLTGPTKLPGTSNH